MRKLSHEFRDPIHTFIRVDNHDRAVIDSPPVQRLRHIHQLAMSYLVYPGATHRRFEHSLGVMELAGQVFDVITRRENLTEALQDALPEVTDSETCAHWRRVLRMAALCHDLGHLPFSHAQEGLLPEGWTHERMTVALITSPAMEELWGAQRPRLDSKDIAKLAVGQKEFSFHFPDESPLTDWEAILSEIVIGDAFGADRIDYLLRDSLHAGVAYGRFDHFRLIDTLRLLPAPGAADGDDSAEPQLGVTAGGSQSAEALLLARYFMFTQVYFHPVRRIYDIHLGEFLQEWLAPDGHFPTDVDAYSALTDAEVIAALRAAARNTANNADHPARRIIERNHFKWLWSRNRRDLERNPDADRTIYRAACAEFGEDAIRLDPSSSKGAVIDFPVQASGGQILSAQWASDVLQHLPPINTGFIFVRPDLKNRARKWLDDNLDGLVQEAPTEGKR